jgi:hypothetical protein
MINYLEWIGAVGGTGWALLILLQLHDHLD